MRMLFVLRSWANVHYYHTLIAALCSRGHTVHLLFDEGWSRNDPKDALDTLLSECPNVTWGYLRVRGISNIVVRALRELRSYRRYLVMDHQSDYYRRRWRRYLPFVLKVLVRIPGVDRMLSTEAVGRTLSNFEDRLSPVPSVRAHVQELEPAVVIAAPLNMRFSTELEYVKAAKALSIPTVLPIYSWDNLTTKGLIHVHPDLVLVWNEVQKKEALVHHGINERSVRVSGAFFFDTWQIPRKPTPREEFCREWNLNPQTPFVLYLGSSRNIAASEVWIITELQKSLHKGGLAGVHILARPHPANSRPYEGLTLLNTTVMPPGKGVPATPRALQSLYDALWHAAAVVGINTSAMLDAICLDRPVISILTPEYKETQEEAAHFNALRASGAIDVVADATACATHISVLLKGTDATAPARKKFLSEWMLPRGAGRLAGECGADEIEALAGRSIVGHN